MRAETVVSRLLAEVDRRVRKYRDDERREVVEQPPPVGRRRAAIERNLNRRRLTHHSHSERSSAIEVARHRFVSVHRQLKRNVAHVIQRVDSHRLQSNACLSKTRAERRDD